MKLQNIQFSFFKLLFVVTAIAFICNGSSFINFFIDNNTRFILISLLFILLAVNNHLAKCFNFKLFIVFIFYISWCILTAFWSENFSITLIKSLSLGLISLTFSSASYQWVSRYGWRNSLSWLRWVLFIAIISGVFGWLKPGSTYGTQVIKVYTGLTSNSNTFGFICAITFPLLFWQCRRKGVIWLSLMCLNAYYLIRSFSRSSFIIMLTTSVFWVLSLNAKKKVLVLTLTALFFIASATVVFPLIQNYIYKNTQHTNILLSREPVWAMSYMAAEKGGWLGVGYGYYVSLKGKGLSATDNLWLYSRNNSREKGNSQLAAVEETGYIGLVLHSVFLWMFFVPAFRFWQTLAGEKKIFFGVTLGSTLGLILQSIFESWWSGPLSQENAYFWLMFGITRGLMNFMQREN